MASEPKLSIITITYNDPNGLKDTIDSLRGLEPSPAWLRGGWEHVIIDSSPAENDVTLAGLPPGWPLSHHVSPAEGVYAAQNVGLARAHGKYVWFLNGGDKLCSLEALERALAALDAYPDASVVASAADLRRNGKHLYIHRPDPRVWPSLLGMNRVCHQALLYRRTVFDRFGPFSTSYRLAADYEHHLRAVAGGAKVLALPDNVITTYDMSGRSSDFALAFREFKQIQRELAPKLPKWLAVSNEVVRPLEHLRVATFKKLGKSKLGSSVLRPLWHEIKRRRGN